MERMRCRRAVVLLVVATVACSTVNGGGRDAGAHRTIDVLAVWQGTEQQHFTRVLRAFRRASGVRVRYTSSAGADIASVLDRRWAADRPPDVALLPQPALLRRYARAGRIVDIEHFLGPDVRARYARVWWQLASWHGHLYGVWFKAAHKSLVWYDVAVFERLGIVAPEDLTTFAADAQRLHRAGVPAFAVGASREDAWTLTDCFENLYARLAGLRKYDALARHAIAWTDPSVVNTLEWFIRLLSPSTIAGGARGALTTSFPESVDATFARDPRAAMVMEGDFVPGVASRSRALGVDVDAFVFPGTAATSRVVIGGGDVAVLMRDTPEGRAFLRYLASAAAAEVWAREGGFVSPNDDVALTAYPNGVTRRIARSVLDAGDEFRFDLSDLQPVEFGGTAGRGMFAILRDLLVDRNVERAATRLEAAAAAAYAR
jgi:alpha-glucoside transport system substrate-binding protein